MRKFFLFFLMMMAFINIYPEHIYLLNEHHPIISFKEISPADPLDPSQPYDQAYENERRFCDRVQVIVKSIVANAFDSLQKIKSSKDFLHKAVGTFFEKIKCDIQYSHELEDFFDFGFQTAKCLRWFIMECFREAIPNQIILAKGSKQQALAFDYSDKKSLKKLSKKAKNKATCIQLFQVCIERFNKKFPEKISEWYRMCLASKK